MTTIEERAKSRKEYMHQYWLKRKEDIEWVNKRNAQCLAYVMRRYRTDPTFKEAQLNYRRNKKINNNNDNSNNNNDNNNSDNNSNNIV